jgi:hypothetical protein
MLPGVSCAILSLVAPIICLLSVLLITSGFVNDLVFALALMLWLMRNFSFFWHR